MGPTPRWMTLPIQKPFLHSAPQGPIDHLQLCPQSVWFLCRSLSDSVRDAVYSVYSLQSIVQPLDSLSTYNMYSSTYTAGTYGASNPPADPSLDYPYAPYLAYTPPCPDTPARLWYHSRRPLTPPTLPGVHVFEDKEGAGCAAAAETTTLTLGYTYPSSFPSSYPSPL
ncbi:hypothetical protein BDP27DRAFT_172263 [Rhodocollybia butyracea]|uniref:Uncharacterized protein n=1 Tax=Rhodocollybia butyracea TaxID=206335 RepID=A0A9P5PEM3_9AGAR|nr:hypothetical protein BDP27DRAFT_172263 [Rhodocollybia butyracea]